MRKYWGPQYLATLKKRSGIRKLQRRRIRGMGFKPKQHYRQAMKRQWKRQTNRRRQNTTLRSRRTRSNPSNWTSAILSHMPTVQNITIMGHISQNVLTDLAMFGNTTNPTAPIDAISGLFVPNLSQVPVEQWQAFRDIAENYNGIRFTGATVMARVTNPLMTSYAKNVAGNLTNMPATFDWERISTDFHMGRPDLLGADQNNPQWWMRPTVKHTKSGRWIINKLHVTKADLQHTAWKDTDSYFGGTQIPVASPDISLTQLLAKAKPTNTTAPEINHQYPTHYFVATSGMPYNGIPLGTTDIENQRMRNAYAMTFEYKVYFHFQCKDSE